MLLSSYGYKDAWQEIMSEGKAETSTSLKRWFEVMGEVSTSLIAMAIRRHAKICQKIKYKNQPLRSYGHNEAYQETPEG